MAADNLVPNSATNKKVKWVPGSDPDAAGTILPSAGWSRQVTANVTNMINGRDGVNRKPSYSDATFNVTSFYDEVDWAPGASFSEGDTGYLFFYYTDTKYVRERAIIMDYSDDPGNPADPHSLMISAARERGTAETFGEDTP